MKLGLLADIHEDVEHLQVALRRFELEGVDQVVVLGDFAEMNNRLDETCRLLHDAGAIGVWGNHDFGICQTARHADKYPPSVRQFMSTLKPRLEINGCLFNHVEPWLNAEDLAELWYFEGIPDTPRQISRSFAVTSAQLLFVGHFHRWLAATENAISDWKGMEVLKLDVGNRYFFGIAAVCDGASAILDLEKLTLTPHSAP